MALAESQFSFADQATPQGQVQVALDTHTHTHTHTHTLVALSSGTRAAAEGAAAALLAASCSSYQHTRLPHCRSRYVLARMGGFRGWAGSTPSFHKHTHTHTMLCIYPLAHLPSSAPAP